MNLKFVRNISIGIIGTLGAVYLLFLILPFILSPVLNNYIPQINDEIKKATGLESSIEGIRLVTTPKLTVGAKVGKFVLLTPDKSEILNTENFQIKMSLLPILVKRIELDLVQLDKIDVRLNLNKDGSFEIEKYFPAQTEPLPIDEEPVQQAVLPFGLRLSNHLPDIRIGGYNIEFKDISSGKAYVISGGKTDITDFVLNKSIKVSANGKVTLADREQFNYNLKINNKIMPDLDLHELVFNPQEEMNEKDKNQNAEINILEIFKGLYDYKITANLDADLTLKPSSYNGYMKLDNLSIAPSGMVLPASDLKLNFKNTEINIDSNIYTAKDEKSTVTGKVRTGKKTNLDINVKSGAELANLVKILNSAAMTFNIKDLQTLSANGKLDADFNIKSDLKKVNSNGYLKIPSAKVRYGLYNITVDNINADVALDNNNVNIKNISFSIFEQPLKFYGLIKQDATADLHLTADKLSLKGLIIACGQAALLKENQVNSGLVSLKADITGKLDSIKPTAKIILSNINIKNIPADTVVKLPATDINIVADGTSFSGTAISSQIQAINPAATVNIPKLSANIKEDAIEVTQTPVRVEKINFSLSGKIKNYLTEKISLDFVTTGDIKSKLTGDMNVVKQTLNLAFATTQDSTIVVPLFDKSKMVFNSNLSITGNMMNPQVSGSVNVISLNMPEIPLTMENISARLRGDMFNGNASAAKFVSGGIAADTITTDFSMKGNYIYLNNMKGSAFDGKFNGNIVYNMANAKTAVDFKGENMNAEKAIEGAAGIKKALSGTLGFNTKLNLIVYPDFNDMMRSITGDLSFRIDKGAFGTIGRLESFLHANNIIGNSVLKVTVASFSNIAAIKDSAVFDYISGEMTLSNGWANIKNIRSTGKSIAYFVTGKYNLINGTANVSILGRLSGKIVKLLGPIGELSAEKILSYIPKLGELTSKLSSEMTADPDKERTKDIPTLSNNEEIYKDFKVVFNGGVESTSSIKSFKWLTKVDTSAIQQQTVTETFNSLKTNLTTDKDATVKTIKDTVDSVKNQADLFKSSAKEIKNLFSGKTSVRQTTTAPTETVTKPAAAPAATPAETPAATPTAPAAPEAAPAATPVTTPAATPVAAPADEVPAAGE